MLGRLCVPWADVAEVRVRDRTLPPGTVLVEPDGDRLVAHLAVVQQTNVDVVFRGPVALALRQAAGRAVHELRCYADEPHALAATARARLAPAAQRQPPVTPR
ncbi:MAG TPA: hypothetical protein VFY17_09775 [Pilimelia sp.]|nr:hypothetical protein [Pilimelia sp.]